LGFERGILEMNKDFDFKMGYWKGGFFFFSKVFKQWSEFKSICVFDVYFHF